MAFQLFKWITRNNIRTKVEDEAVSIEGAITISGLARNAVLRGPGTYSLTEILGYKILSAGAADWGITFEGGTSIAIPPTAQILGSSQPEYLSSITVPAGGSALLYIPVA